VDQEHAVLVDPDFGRTQVTQRQIRTWAVRAVPILILLAYAPTLVAFFNSDDFQLIDALSRGGPFAIWTSNDLFFRPLTSASLYLDWWLWGTSASGYHLVSLAIHILNSVLVGWIAARLTSVSSHHVSRTSWAIGAALFGLLPSHSEAVAWIAARGDLLATLGALGSTALFISGQDSGRRSRFLLAHVCFAVGLLAKESIVLLPGILFLLDLLFFRTKPLQALRHATISGAIALLFVALRGWMVGDWIGGYGASHLQWGHVVSNLPYYPIRILTPPLRRVPFVIISVIAAVSVAYWVARRVRVGDRIALGRGVAFVLAFTLAAAPTLSLAVSRGTVEGERFLYWPSVLVCIALLAAIGRPHITRFSGAIGSVALSALLLWTGLSAAKWSDASAQCEAALEAVARLPEARQVYVGPLVDNRAGAYVFRNGFEAGVRLFDNDGTQNPLVVSRIRWDQRRPRYRLDIAVAQGGQVIEVESTGGGLRLQQEEVRGMIVETLERRVAKLRLPDVGPEDIVVVIDSDGIRSCRPMDDC
jgi:hypothetical protein